MVSANVSAGNVKPRMDTGTPAISLAMGASWAIAIRPPAPTITNMAYMTQNTGVRMASAGP